MAHSHALMLPTLLTCDLFAYSQWMATPVPIAYTHPDRGLERWLRRIPPLHYLLTEVGVVGVGMALGEVQPMRVLAVDGPN